MSVIDAPIKTTVTPDQDRRDVLLRAARIIEEQGWIAGWQGMSSPDGPKCILGAVYVALGGNDWETDARYLDTESFCQLKAWTDATRWNDNGILLSAGLASEYTHVPVDQDRVVDVLRKMADGQTFYEATGVRRDPAA